MNFEVGRSGSGVDGVSRDLKMRVCGGGGGGSGTGNGVNGEVDEKIRNGKNGYDKESVGKDGQSSDVKRYDADGKGFSHVTRNG